MALTKQDIDQIEHSLQQLKLQDLQQIIANLNGSKFGKKAELVQRLILQLRNNSSQERCFRAIRDYQQRMNARYNAGYMPGLNPYAFGGQQGPSAYQYGQNGPQFPGPPKLVNGLRAVPLPFFDVMDCIVETTELPAAASIHQKMSAKQTIMFSLSPNQGSLLSYNSDTQPLPRHEVQLRFFHLGDGWQQTPQPDDFPLNCVVRIEDMNVGLPPIIPTNRQNVEPKRPSRPVNLTPVLQSIGRLGSRQYRFTVEWTADRRTWAFSINVVYRVNSNMLIKRLKDRPNTKQPAEVTKKTIIRRLTTGDEDGICLEQVKASVKCPLTRTRLITPVRCQDCDHLQCYDLENYIQMNEKKPTWKCPVCSRPAPFDRLVVDEYFVNVLHETNKDVDEVELLRDGGWKVIAEEAVSLSSDEDNVEDTKPDLKQLAESTTTRGSGVDAGQPPPKKKCPPPTDEIITLDSDDEDIQRATQASLVESRAATKSVDSQSRAIENGSVADDGSSTMTPSTSGPATPVRKNNSRDIEIITLDDTPPKNVAPSSNNAQNGENTGVSWRNSQSISVPSTSTPTNSAPNQIANSIPTSSGQLGDSYQPFVSMNATATPADLLAQFNQLVNSRYPVSLDLESMTRMMNNDAMLGSTNQEMGINEMLLDRANNPQLPTALAQFPAYSGANYSNYASFSRLFSNQGPPNNGGAPHPHGPPQGFNYNGYGSATFPRKFRR